MQELDKKFIESIVLDDYEILTDDGFKDVCALHKTIEYDVYKLCVGTKELKCADKHIVFKENGEEIFVEDLKIGDFIQTVDGFESVISNVSLGYKKNMWDFELTDNNVKYYTNGILSHNTMIIRKLISMLSEKKTIIYIPSYMMHSIADPELISFISNFTNTILLLEDAENVLTKQADERSQAVANILNMTDGLLNDSLELQIIATFNIDSKMIDPALKRAGRLVVNQKFKKLSIDESNKLSKHIGSKRIFTKEATLAEIYEGNNQIITDDLIDDKPKIGFKLN